MILIVICLRLGLDVVFWELKLFLRRGVSVRLIVWFGLLEIVRLLIGGMMLERELVCFYLMCKRKELVFLEKGDVSL